MNKTELISAVAEANNITKKVATNVVESVIATVEKALVSGDKVQLMGFGSFETRKRAARTGLNPATKQPIKIAASTAVVFKAGKALKDACNKKK